MGCDCSRLVVLSRVVLHFYLCSAAEFGVVLVSVEFVPEFLFSLAFGGGVLFSVNEFG